MSTSRSYRSFIASASFAIVALALTAHAASAHQLAPGQTALGVTSDGRQVTTQIQHGQEKLLIWDGIQWQNASGMNLNIKFNVTASGSQAATFGHNWVNYNAGHMTTLTVVATPAPAPGQADARTTSVYQPYAAPAAYRQQYVPSRKKAYDLNKDELNRLGAGTQQISAPQKAVPPHAAPPSAPVQRNVAPESQPHPAAVAQPAPALTTPATAAFVTPTTVDVTPPVPATAAVMPAASAPVVHTPAPTVMHTVTEPAATQTPAHGSVVGTGTICGNTAYSGQRLTFVQFYGDVVPYRYDTQLQQQIRMRTEVTSIAVDRPAASVQLQKLYDRAVQTGGTECAPYDVKLGRFRDAGVGFLTYQKAQWLEQQVRHGVIPPALKGLHSSEEEKLMLAGTGITALPLLRRRKGLLDRLVNSRFKILRAIGCTLMALFGTAKNEIFTRKTAPPRDFLTTIRSYNPALGI